MYKNFIYKYVTLYKNFTVPTFMNSVFSRKDATDKLIIIIKENLQDL